MMPQPQGHLLRPPHKEPPLHAPNAALLIDFDNVTMAIRSDLQTELKRLLQSEIIRGKVAVQRAYADWRRYPQYIVPLSESSIDLIFAPAYGANKKNATDIRLAIDALELVFTRPEIGTFILLSGDSDFSSLVLKLKEYGKYIIGVGIRESSSDLLIQNCDEYYSYNELAGFTKESEVTYEHRDPWELVVEAVKQMTAHNDVMRSDRLKQVMQEIDPSFDEKDSGFSRFSKFVAEAAHRGLVALTKRDNGQFEIALGPEVAGAAAQPTARASSAREAEAPPAREGRGDGRGRRGSGAGGGSGGFSLGDAFGLLKQALGRLGAEERPVDAEQVRDAMVDISGAAAGPLEPDRFPNLLRQAQDAQIIDLSQEEDGAYAVRLHAVEPGSPPPENHAEAAGDAEEPPAVSREPGGAAAAPSQGVPTRSARFRRGSRGSRVAPPGVPKIGVVEIDPNFKPRSEAMPAEPAPLEARSEPSIAPRSEPRAPREPSGRVARGGRDRDGGERAEREPGARRSRRGGRGRGGRSRRPNETSGSTERIEPREREMPRPERMSPPPPPVVASEPKAREEPEGESFWSKVKRGLTGGE
jgi:uncharacterized protein (TIGR00288 family)